MEQATRLRQPRLGDYLERAWREGALWAVVILSLYLVLALATYSPDDPGWSFVGAEGAVNNAAGRLGAWFADLTLFLVGVFAYLIPVALAASAFLVFREHEPEPETKLYWLVLRWSGLLLTLGAGAGLASLQVAGPFGDLPNGIGGAFGLLIADTASAGFGLGGGSLVLLGLLLTGLSLFTGMSPLLIVDGIGDLALLLLRLPPRLYRQIQAARAERRQHPPQEDWEHDDWEAGWTTDWNDEDEEIENGPDAELAPMVDKGPPRDAEEAALETDAPPSPRAPRNAIHILAASQPSPAPLVSAQPRLQIGIGAGFEAASAPVRARTDVAVRTNVSEESAPEFVPESAPKPQTPQPAPTAFAPTPAQADLAPAPESASMPAPALQRGSEPTREPAPSSEPASSRDRESASS
ncbi:MAG: DNA translocase FtsK 4TM domain-containing protein, partial [Halochromatium sp.]|uniref:DNA translocase FtsK 4TM domain-containing protein n=1 Tax=Halochromatium sp. TaxID=2049430 RepID=UPI003978CEAC